MEKGKVTGYTLDYELLKARQSVEKSNMEAPETLEELSERYGDLAERILALPPREPERVLDTPGGASERFLDRYVEVEVGTGNSGVSRLKLTLHTGHRVYQHHQYEPRQATYIDAEWKAPDLTNNGGGTLIVQRESLLAPTEQADIEEAGRMLGLLEESVAEAEAILLPLAA